MSKRIIGHSKALRKTISRIDELGQGGDRLFESCQVMDQVSRKMPSKAKTKTFKQAASITITKEYPPPKGPKSDTSQ